GARLVLRSLRSEDVRRIVRSLSFSLDGDAVDCAATNEQRLHLVNTTRIRSIRKIESLTRIADRLSLEQLEAPLGRQRSIFAEDEPHRSSKDGSEEDWSNEPVKADSRRLGSRYLRMSRE